MRSGAQFDGRIAAPVCVNVCVCLCMCVLGSEMAKEEAARGRRCPESHKVHAACFLCCCFFLYFLKFASLWLLLVFECVLNACVCVSVRECVLHSFAHLNF